MRLAHFLRFAAFLAFAVALMLIVRADCGRVAQCPSAAAAPTVLLADAGAASSGHHLVVYELEEAPTFAPAALPPSPAAFLEETSTPLDPVRCATSRPDADVVVYKPVRMIELALQLAPSPRPRSLF